MGSRIKLLRNWLIEAVLIIERQLPLGAPRPFSHRNEISDSRGFHLASSKYSKVGRQLSKKYKIAYLETHPGAGRFARFIKKKQIEEVAGFADLVVVATRAEWEAVVLKGVPVVEMEAESRELLNSPLARKKLATKQFREFALNKFAKQGKNFPLLSVIVSTKRPEQIAHVREQFDRQTYPNKELIILTHGYKAEGALYEPKTSPLGYCLNRLITASKGDFIAKFDDDDFYLDNYLLDQFLNLSIRNVDIVGKAANYLYFSDKNVIALRRCESANQLTDFVAGATLMGRREIFEQHPFRELGKGEDSAFLKDIRLSNVQIYSTDPFNFLVVRHGRHTWEVADTVLAQSAVIETYGLNLPHVEI
ncbi:hypothetical protein HMPREF2734_01290 [Corynebacterium sp. HMSC055D05]|nr:hypothetical protein HMPREF2734_01290 [Corynebacterium sp. HMSC055D05]